MMWKRDVLPILLAGAIGCGSDTVVQPLVSDASTLYWKLEVNHPAVMLSVHAPYDTVQLVATPRNVYGEPLPSSGVVQFRNIVEIDTSLQITPGGRITARTTTASARVEAVLTIDGVTHSDTTVIMVRNESPVRMIDSIDFQPVAPDSAQLWAGRTTNAPLGQTQFNRWLKVYANGARLLNSQLVVGYSWENNDVVGMDLLETLIGETYIRARVHAYGRTVSDSMLFRRIAPPVKVIVFQQLFPTHGPPTGAFFPGELSIRSGTTVIFLNRGIRAGFLAEWGGNPLRTTEVVGSRMEYVDSVDVIFEDSALVAKGDAFGRWNFFPAGLSQAWPSDGGSGNIPAFGERVCTKLPGEIEGCVGIGTGFGTPDSRHRSRKFVTPGTYHYSSSRYPGARGTIIVQD